ncbi:MAG TPA: hypothetical protein VK678_23380, partial [Bradyrhizobium sp.]|nr:hypothetical protein [Bradyrhizobium sp.]
RDRHFDEATIANGYRHRNLPFVFCCVSQASTCVKRVKVGQGRGLIGWAEMHPTDIPKYTAGGGCNQQVVQCSSAYSIKTTAGLIRSANIRKPSEADRVLRCCPISHLPHERASLDAAAPAMYVEAYTILKQARSISTANTTIPEPAPRQ